MDADRFDALSRAFTGNGSRRRALAAVFGVTLGLLGPAQPDDAAAARSGKCKTPCGECERCKKGDCRRKNGKKRCKPGRCEPAANMCRLACGTTGTCSCMLLAGSARSVCIDVTTPAGPCTPEGGCVTPGEVCVDPTACGEDEDPQCRPPCAT